MTSEEYIRRLVDNWPPLTSEQRARLRTLMRPGPRHESQPARSAA
ncbi:hypothetical protein [Streptomyces sp. NPDC056160]